MALTYSGSAHEVWALAVNDTECGFLKPDVSDALKFTLTVGVNNDCELEVSLVGPEKGHLFPHFLPDYNTLSTFNVMVVVRYCLVLAICDCPILVKSKK